MQTRNLYFKLVLLTFHFWISSLPLVLADDKVNFSSFENKPLLLKITHLSSGLMGDKLGPMFKEVFPSQGEREVIIRMKNPQTLSIKTNDGLNEMSINGFTADEELKAMEDMVLPKELIGKVTLKTETSISPLESGEGFTLEYGLTPERKTESDQLPADLGYFYIYASFRINPHSPKYNLSFDDESPLARSRESNLKLMDEGTRAMIGSVFRISKVMELWEQKEEAGTTGSEQGTGFFVSLDGLALTNHHVIVDFCLPKLECEFTITLTQKDGTERQYMIHAQVLTASRMADFALLRINLPEKLGVVPVELELKLLFKKDDEIFTVGYPGDRDVFTYSKGIIARSNSKIYHTTAYVSSGASGSPLFAVSNRKVIGLINSSSSEESNAISIKSINETFDLQGYFSHQKFEKVTAILSKLREAKTADQASAAMNEYNQENTYLGLTELQDILINHPESAVRRAITKGLKDCGLMCGSNEPPLPISTK